MQRYSIEKYQKYLFSRLWPSTNLVLVSKNKIWNCAGQYAEVLDANLSYKIKDSAPIFLFRKYDAQEHVFGSVCKIALCISTRSLVGYLC